MSGEVAGKVYTLQMGFTAAYQHEDGALCVCNGATGTWYSNDDGHTMRRLREICEREHPETLLARIEALAARWRALSEEDPHDPCDPGGYAAELAVLVDEEREL